MNEDSLVNGVLHSTTVSDQVYTILREKIIDGNLKAGETLVTSQLAEMLNTSRTPLREALKRLEEAGWVERRTNGVVAVTEMSVKELQEIYSVRAVLEGLATFEATSIICDDDLIKIENKLSQYNAIDDASKVSNIIDLGQEIHRMIYQAASNATCLNMLEQILRKLNRYRAYSTSVRGRYRQTLSEHREILRRMRERQAEAAELAMRAHILNASAIVTRHMLNLGLSDKL
ncbi:MAG: GntR family transcriptional regulator [Gracilibacteraceae bacterium]|jgi:DNA-binding GntR family transcriptional regulator|nr:GntR family transcriptional regulator [Gracilibacteraceae bacterium]